MSTTSQNSFAHTARMDKANKMALLCQRWGIHSYDVNGWSDHSWTLLQEAAKSKDGKVRLDPRVKAPSEETRGLVVGMLRDREQAGAAALEKDRR